MGSSGGVSHGHLLTPLGFLVLEAFSFPKVDTPFLPRDKIFLFFPYIENSIVNSSHLDHRLTVLCPSLFPLLPPLCFTSAYFPWVRGWIIP